MRRTRRARPSAGDYDIARSAAQTLRETRRLCVNLPENSPKRAAAILEGEAAASALAGVLPRLGNRRRSPRALGEALISDQGKPPLEVQTEESHETQVWLGGTALVGMNHDEIDYA